MTRRSNPPGEPRKARARRLPDFVLEPRAAFDARRGYRRARPPGLGLRVNDQYAVADFWFGPNAGLVVRFTSQGHVRHYDAKRRPGSPIAPGDMDDFAQFVTEVLLEWIIEGVDDEPSSID